MALWQFCVIFVSGVVMGTVFGVMFQTQLVARLMRQMAKLEDHQIVWLVREWK